MDLSPLLRGKMRASCQVLGRRSFRRGEERRNAFSMLSGRRRRIVISSTCAASSTAKFHPDSANQEEICFCHFTFSLHPFLEPLSKTMRNAAESRGTGRTMYQKGVRIEAKERGKSRSGSPIGAAFPFSEAFLKFRAGIFRAKLAFSPEKQGESDAFSNAPPEAKRAKRTLSPQTRGLFEAKEAAEAIDIPRAAAGKSRGGPKRPRLTSLPPEPGAKESKSNAPQSAQKEGKRKKARAKTMGRERSQSGAFFASSFLSGFFTGPAFPPPRPFRAPRLWRPLWPGRFPLFLPWLCFQRSPSSLSTPVYCMPWG